MCKIETGNKVNHTAGLHKRFGVPGYVVALGPFYVHTSKVVKEPICRR